MWWRRMWGRRWRRWRELCEGGWLVGSGEWWGKSVADSDGQRVKCWEE